MNKLYRSTTDRVFGGVCGGLAAYMGVSSLFVRIMFVLIAMANGTGLAVYLLMWLLVPSESSAGAPQDQVVRDNLDEMRARAQSLGKTRDLSSDAQPGSAQRKGSAALGSASARQWMLLIGTALVVLGALVLLDNLGLLWWFGLGKLWPLLLIGVGVAVLLNNLREAR